MDKRLLVILPFVSFLATSCGDGYRKCVVIAINNQEIASTSYQTERFVIGAYKFSSLPSSLESKVLGYNDYFYLCTSYYYNYKTREGYYKPLPNSVVATFSGLSDNVYLNKYSDEIIIETYNEAYYNEGNRTIKTITEYQRSIQTPSSGMIGNNNYFYKLSLDSSSSELLYKINFVNNSSYNLYVPDPTVGQLYKPKKLTSFISSGNNDTVTYVYED